MDAAAGLPGKREREADVRVGDYAEMLSPAFGELIDGAGARLITFAALRDLQRDA